MGEVIKPHGLKGEVAVKVFSDNSDRFRPGEELVVEHPGGSATSVVVSSSRKQSTGRLLQFHGVDDRSQAEQLRGALLLIPKPRRGPLEQDAFWPDELVGYSAVDPSGKPLGVVIEVLERGEQDLIKLDTPSGEALIPAAKGIVTALDGERRTIEIDAPDGLLP